MRTARTILLGALLAYALVVIVRCALSWYHGGAADPRCVYRWKGYVEWHHLVGKTGDRVRCKYEPEVARRAR
jgi:hypothetical protein